MYQLPMHKNTLQHFQLGQVPLSPCLRSTMTTTNLQRKTKYIVVVQGIGSVLDLWTKPKLTKSEGLQQLARSRGSGINVCL